MTPEAAGRVAAAADAAGALFLSGKQCRDSAFEIVPVAALRQFDQALRIFPERFWGQAFLTM